jgi:antitoxin MazE
MKVKVAKWGNSLGVRLPKSAVDLVGVRAGTELELTVEGRDLRLRSMVKTSAQLLEELLDQIDPNNVPPMLDWGPDVGSEIIDDAYSRGEIAMPRSRSRKKPPKHHRHGKRNAAS